MALWKPIEAALRDPRVTGNQETIFVLRAEGDCPAYNAVYYDHLQAGAGETHPWIFADGGGAYARDWPTHWMLAEEAAPLPGTAAQIEARSMEARHDDGEL